MHIKRRIQEAREELARHGLSDPVPPCPAEDVAELRRSVLDQFGVELPAAYCELLEVSDGTGLDSVIYGSRPLPADHSGGVAAPGIMEANEALRIDLPAFVSKFAFGETESGWLILDLAAGQFKLFGHSGDDLELFRDFDELLEYALRRV